MCTCHQINKDCFSQRGAGLPQCRAGNSSAGLVSAPPALWDVPHGHLGRGQAVGHRNCTNYILQTKQAALRIQPDQDTCRCSLGTPAGIPEVPSLLDNPLLLDESENGNVSKLALTKGELKRISGVGPKVQLFHRAQ